MIKVNGYKIEPKQFPDGSLMLLDLPSIVDDITENYITWKYEGDHELVTLIYLVGHMRDLKPKASISLNLPYIPNARMDRVKNLEKELFTLKHFAKIINSLGFSQVNVFDPHSDVSVALLDHVSVKSPAKLLEQVLTDIIYREEQLRIQYAIASPSMRTDFWIYFPDKGAKKRYEGIFSNSRFHLCYGEKTRDWETGKITGIKIIKDKINELPVCSYPVIMIDDIISYGGTLAYSADELKKQICFSRIYAYASHTENSVLDRDKGTLLKRLESGIVERLYTTDSIYNLKHPNIEAFVI